MKNVTASVLWQYHDLVPFDFAPLRLLHWHLDNHTEQPGRYGCIKKQQNKAPHDHVYILWCILCSVVRNIYRYVYVYSWFAHIHIHSSLLTRNLFLTTSRDKFIIRGMGDMRGFIPEENFATGHQPQTCGVSSPGVMNGAGLSGMLNLAINRLLTV